MFLTRYNVQCLSFNFDVIALSETWLNLYDNLDVLNLVGYDLCSKTRQNKRGGGVAMYIRNDIRFEVLDNISCSIDNVLECICVKLYLSLKRSIIVSCLYRRPGSTINTTIDFIEKNVSGKKCDLYICGDFNVNLLTYDNHNDTQIFLHSFMSL